MTNFQASLLISIVFGGFALVIAALLDIAETLSTLIPKEDDGKKD